MVGLCSAIPTPAFRAGGELGESQLERLEDLLGELGERGFCRVVMVHHPVAAQGEASRRALSDGEGLRTVLARAGAELVVHGHKHRRLVNWAAGPVGEIPVVGVPSSSEVGSKPGRLAQYHVYTARAHSEGGYSLEAEIRGFDPAARRFVRIDEQLFDLD